MGLREKNDKLYDYDNEMQQELLVVDDLQAREQIKELKKTMDTILTLTRLQ